MAIDMGGVKRAPMDLSPEPTADKVTITRAQGGGFAVECQRAEGVETSMFPDFDGAMGYVASELQGAAAGAEEAAEAPPMRPPAGGPPPPMPEEMA